jgi:hypothetical protein
MTYTLAWSEVGGNGNNLLEPGEGARVKLTVTMSPPSGTAGTWATTVSPGGSGTYRAIQAVFLDIVGAGGAEGVWTDIVVDELFELGLNGTPAAGGTRVNNINAGQLPPASGGINTTNPMVNLWMGTWTPSAYATRSVTFTTANGSANPNSQANAIIVRDPTANTTVFIGRGHDVFGSVQIPIIPAPASVAVLGAGCVWGVRRCRRS